MGMTEYKGVDRALYVFTGLILLTALLLTFTVSDYYIFNRFGQYNTAFIISQWMKKAGFLLLPLAVYFKKRSCADAAKYLLPVFCVTSLFTYGDFFDATMVREGAADAANVYAHINEFLPKEAVMLLFFVQAELILAVCALLFVRDGFKASPLSFKWAAVAFLAVTPLNIFENFYDVNDPKFGRGSFFWFTNFSVWHFLALAALAGATVAGYFFLKNKPKKTQDEYLAAFAIILLIHYHSKDSFILGDGYNVYHTVFACIPLFICNIGVYIASLSVFLKKRVLYAISFFVHSAGALSVFVYFGQDSTTNFGIIISRSILYFCLVHCLLFMLAVLPSALGRYKYRPKDCIIPLLYYFTIIVAAAILSAVVTSASMDFCYNGYTLREGEWLLPNYAFTQINPLPIKEPYAPLKIWRYELNVLYLLILYAVYVGLFFIMNGGYYLFLYIRKALLKRGRAENAAPLPEGEIAASEDNGDSEEK